MSDTEKMLEQQVLCQERQINELRVQIAIAEKRIAQKDLFIHKLQLRLAKFTVSKRTKAEALFSVPTKAKA